MRKFAPPAALLIASLLMGWFAHRLGLGSITRPEPGFFPFWICFGLAATSLYLVTRSLRPDPEEEASTESESVFTLAGYRRVFTVMAGTALFGLLLEFSGFLATTFIFMAFCWLVIDRQPLLRGLLISAAASAAAFFLFVKLLNVHFPRGLLGF